MAGRLEPQNYHFTPLPYLFDGGGTALTVSEWPGFYLPERWVIRSWHLFGPTTETGSITISLRAATYGGYPAVVEILPLSIPGGNKNANFEPPSSGALSVEIAAGSFVVPFITAVSGFTWVSMNLNLEQNL